MIIKYLLGLTGEGNNNVNVLNIHAHGWYIFSISSFLCHPCGIIGCGAFLTDYSGQAYEFVLYLPWGQELAQQKVAGYATPYRFTGKERDSETGLYYYGARYYDPMVGQFFGVDPLASKYPGISGYTYCVNNPIRFIDPDGKDVYDPDGNWLRANTKAEGDWAYVKSGNSLTSLGISESDFRSSAAIVQGETRENNMQENFAIASAILNANKGKSEGYAAKAEKISYADNDKRTRYIAYGNNAGSNNGGLEQKYTNAAIINALTGGVDYSNGAVAWDGTEVLTGSSKPWKPEKHFRQQKAAFDERKGIIDPNSFSGDFYHNGVDVFCGKKFEKFVKPLQLTTSANPLWQVTASYGTCIFYKEIKK